MANEVKITIGADTAQAERQFDSFLGKIKGHQYELRRLGIILTGVGAAFSGFGFLALRSAVGMDGLANITDDLRDALDELAATFGEHLLPAFILVVNALARIVEGFNIFFQQNSEIAKMVVVVGALVAVFASIAGPVLIFISILPALMGGFALLGLTLGGVLLAIAAVAAVIVAGVLIWQNWGTIVGFFNGLLDKVNAALAWTEQAIRNFFSITIPAWWNNLIGWLNTAWTFTINAVGDFWTKTLPSWWDNLKDFLGKAWSTTINFAFGWMDAVIGQFWSWALSGFRTVVGFAFGWMDGPVGQIWSWALSGMKVAVTFIGGGLDMIVGQIWSWAFSGLRVVVNFAAGSMDAVKGFVNGVIDYLNQQLDQTWFSFVDIPRLARGGIASGAAIVGEEGPELAIFPTGTRIVPNNQMGGMGSNTLIINYHQNAPVFGLLDFQREVVQLIRDAAISGGFRGVLVTE